MVRYTLLGTPIAFDDGAERFFDLQYRSWTAQDRAFEEFSKWYKKYDNIEAILSKYRQFSKELIEKHAVKPLFSTLTTSSIFDVSKESYYRTCLDLSPVDEALQSVSSKYQQIEQTQAAQERYRQVRKASRGRWQGGGFGLSGALKGAAQAGALNMVSGLGHSMVNAVGNAGSAVAASSSKQALFKNQATFNLLFQGIELSIYSAYEAHMELLNSRKGSGYIRSQFDFDRSSALFENAKKLPNRKEELLTQAVLFCPWNYELLVGISFLALWICFLLKRSSLSDAWNKLTVKGRVLHPAITAELSPAEKRLTPSTWVLLALLAAVCVLTAYNVISSTTLDKSAPLESDTSQTLESDISQPLHEEETSAPEQAESPVYDTSAYYNILGGYYIVLMDGYSASMLEENNFNALCAYYDASQVGYAIQDVDGNGVPELLIGEIGEAGGGSGAFFDLYTLVDGQAVLVAASSERDRYYICQDGTIANEGSFGADDSYNAYYTIDPTTGTCSILEAVVYQGFYENAGPWFYTTLVPWEASVYDGSQTEISEAEAAQIMQNHSYKAIEFQAIPAM